MVSLPGRRLRPIRRACCTIVALVAVLASAAPAGAQSAADLRRLQSLTPEQRAQLRERLEQGEAASPEDTLAEPGRTELPEQPAVVLPLSQTQAESVVAEATGDTADEAPSDLFGADFFRGDPAMFGPQSFGPVPADYLIGPGDQIVVDVWGEVEFRHERVVDRDGTIILPRAGRISAANRTLEDLTRAIRQQLSRSYSGIDPSGEGGTTFVDVSLGRLRAIRVFVVGEAARPGAYELSSVSTVFTALHAAGGPNAQGSLRNVTLMRGTEQVATVDLYDYLLRGERSGDVILREGDTVFVPIREVTVRASGAVRRPMRYELIPGEGVADLVRYAGGFAVDAVTDLVHVTRVLPPAERVPGEPDRVQRDLDLGADPNPMLLDGDRLSVDRVPERLLNVVEVQGNVKNAGRYEYVEGETVAGLVERAGGLWDDTLLERATLDRVDDDGTYRSQDVPLRELLSDPGRDLELQPRDVLTIYSIWDVNDRFSVTVSGEVRSPGTFDWRKGLTLRDVVLKAGGLRQSADRLRAEVSRLRLEALREADSEIPPERTIDVTMVTLGDDWLQVNGSFELEPFDRVQIRRLPWWQTQRTVQLRGEVMYPGEYSLESPDERLSSVIERAGGLKPTAYLAGARLERSQDSIGNVALDLEKALENPEDEHDVILEAGDEIVVPPEPYTVKVVGAVNFSTSVVWEDGLGLSDYVSRAGGYAERADKWGTHVVYANGMSRPIRRFWRDPEVRPGSTVVVPVKEPDEGPTRLETLREISAIVASVATVWLVIDRTD